MGVQAEVERDEVVLAKRLAAEFERVTAWMELHFRRREAHEAASSYVKALLSGAERKNAWGLAEAAGKPAPYCFQHLLLRAKWDEEGVRDDVLAYAREQLGEGGVLVVDETGFLKKGDKSAGVARQYTGTAGRIENCQVGVFLAYETPRGHALVDRELYLPEEWTQNRPRRQEAGVPDAVSFRTKTQLARAMLLRAFEAGLRPSWVTGDEVYGRDGELRRFLEQRHQRYVLAVASNTYVWRGFMQVKAGRVLSELEPEDWMRLSAGAGSKGPRLYDWALVRVNSHTGTLARWLLFRRSLADPTDVAHYLVHAPANTSLEAMVKAAGSRWPVEECFESGKDEVGLADYEVRSYTGWYRHMTLCLVAHAYLASARALANAEEQSPPPKALGLPRRRNRMTAFRMRQGLLSTSASPSRR